MIATRTRLLEQRTKITPVDGRLADGINTLDPNDVASSGGPHYFGGGGGGGDFGS